MRKILIINAIIANPRIMPRYRFQDDSMDLPKRDMSSMVDWGALMTLPYSSFVFFI